jgi:hypothetical protein
MYSAPEIICGFLTMARFLAATLCRRFRRAIHGSPTPCNHGLQGTPVQKTRAQYRHGFGARKSDCSRLPRRRTSRSSELRPRGRSDGVPCRSAQQPDHPKRSPESVND